MGWGKKEYRMINYWNVILISVIFSFLFVSNPQINAEASEKFPSKPITILVPYAAGGSSDLVARKLADLAGPLLGQQILVEAKPGGSGVIGVSAVAKAKPDGYTLCLSSCSPSCYVPFQRSVPYDPIEDFTYIIQVGDIAYSFCVRADSKWKTFKEFIEEARQRPNALSYMTGGPKNAAHVRAEYVFAKERVKVNHLPGVGDAEVIRQLLGGHISAGMTGGLWPQIKAAKLRGLAVTSEKRYSTFTDVPTFSELGYKFPFPSGCWFGVVAPKGLPVETSKKLENAFKTAIDDPSYQDFLTSVLYMEPLFKDSKTFTTSVNKEYTNLGEIFKELNLEK